MPTVASQPTLEKTRAVGAILLHQFARERFLEAGISHNLISQAENEEHIADITAALLDDDQHINDDTLNISGCGGDITRNSIDTIRNSIDTTRSFNDTTLNGSFLCTNGDNNVSRNTNNCTNLSDGDERFHSIAESTQTADNTIYHSIHAGNGSDRTASATIDRAQSLRMMSVYGSELRKIAAEFERSRMRQDVKEKADKISLFDLSKESFHKLLEELFQDGVSRVKIVTLFFFCTDVALRAASHAQELVVKLMGWSFSYIIDTVCRIVHELGGWEHIFFQQIPSLLISCCAVLGILALGIYIRKSLLAS